MKAKIDKTKLFTPPDVTLKIISYFNISLEAVKTADNQQSKYVRSILCWALYRFTHLSYLDIGKALGLRTRQIPYYYAAHVHHEIEKPETHENRHLKRDVEKVVQLLHKPKEESK